MGQFKSDSRIYETSVTTGTGEYTLAGAQTGFQPASVIGANNYGPFFITDDVNWEVILGTYITGPDRLQRTKVMASSNGGAAVNWGAGTKKIRCSWSGWLGAPRLVTKSVAGGADVTLTADEQRCDILVLTGAITANINVIVDTTPWVWTAIYNNTSGAYTLTLKTAAGTGKAVTPGKRAGLHCDGVNVEQNDSMSLPLAGGNLSGAANNSKSTVASATTPDIWTGTGHLIDYTGTTPATGFAAAPQAGASRELLCAAAAVFTNGAYFVVAGGNFTAAAGDRILVIAETTTKFRLYPIKADGTPVVTGKSAATNDFRLTLSAGVPVTTADVTAAATVYCSPYKGNQIALYDGSLWNTRTSAEFSLALGTLTSGLPYDVFCYDNAGVPTLEFLAWTNGTTRATALALQDGVLVKSGAATRRYLGTFYTASTTTTEDSESKRFLWNYYHRVARACKKAFTANRSTTSASYVELNSEIRNEFVVGYEEAPVLALASGNVDVVGQTILTTIGLDGAATVDVFSRAYAAGASEESSMAVSAHVATGVGYHYTTLMGRVGGGTGIWRGSGTTAERTTLRTVLT